MLNGIGVSALIQACARGQGFKKSLLLNF